jgi:hypothetical protein
MSDDKKLAAWRRPHIQLCWLAAGIVFLAIGSNGAFCGSKLGIRGVSGRLWYEHGFNMTWWYYLALLLLWISAIVCHRAKTWNRPQIPLLIGFLTLLVPMASMLHGFLTFREIMTLPDLENWQVWMNRMCWHALPLPFAAAALLASHPERRLGWLAISVTAMSVVLLFSYRSLHLSWCDKPHGVMSAVLYYFFNGAVALNGLRLLFTSYPARPQ